MTEHAATILGIFFSIVVGIGAGFGYLLAKLHGLRDRVERIERRERERP